MSTFDNNYDKLKQYQNLTDKEKVLTYDSLKNEEIENKRNQLNQYLTLTDEQKLEEYDKIINYYIKNKNSELEKSRREKDKNE